MHIEPAQQQPSDSERNESFHRGPLSRSWPQLFKKRRRYSPVRESAQQQQQQQQHQQQPPQPQQLQIQPAPPSHEAQGHQKEQIDSPVESIHPMRTLSVATQPMISPQSSIRAPSITDTASTLSSISYASSVPPNANNKVPIARRSSSIVSSESNGAGGVTTPQADLLASKSNYELISSGQHLDMGLHFSTAMATGVMMKRATHRAAEQARRDRMKTAMIDLAEFLLDGEVTFGTGTTCFVVMRTKGSNESDEASGETTDGNGRKESSASQPGEKKTVNKARLIEMALEKMKAQETEIEMLRKELHELRASDAGDHMDVTE